MQHSAEVFRRAQPIAARRGSPVLFVPRASGTRLSREERRARLGRVVLDANELSGTAAAVQLVARDGGVVCELSAADLATLDLYRLEPVRRPSSYKGMKNFIGLYTSRRGPAWHHVWAESLLELAHLREIEFAGQAVELVTQAIQMKWRVQGAEWSHFPDFLMRDTSGELILVDITRQEKLAHDRDLQNLLALTLRTCEMLGIRYEIGVELDRQRTINLSYLCGFRDIPIDLEGRIADVVAHLPRRTSLWAVALMGGGGPEGRAIAAHLLWKQEISLDLSAAIHEHTRVTCAPPIGSAIPVRRPGREVL